MTPFRAGLMLVVCLTLPFSLEGQGPATKTESKPALDAHGDPLPEFARARLGNIRFQAGRPVVSVRFAPDGHSVLSIDNDDRARTLTVRRWDTITGKELHSFPLPRSGHYTLSPDGRTMATWPIGRSVRLWDATTGKLLHELTREGCSLSDVCFTPDGKAVAIDVFDPNNQPKNSIRLWDVATGKESRAFIEASREKDKEFYASDIFFAAGGKILGALGEHADKPAIRLWDFATAKELPALVEYPDRNAVLSADGKLVAALVTDDKERTRVRVWDVASGKALGDLDEPTTEALRLVAFSPDAGLFAAIEAGHTLRLWDVRTKAAPAPASDAKTAIDAVAFSPNGKRLALGMGNGTVQVCEAATGKQLHMLKGYCATGFESNLRRLEITNMPLAFSADGRLLAAPGTGHRVRVWDLTDGKEVELAAGGHEDELASIAVAPAGATFASVDAHGTVRLWETATGRQLLVLPPAPRKDVSVGFIPCIVFSPDGKQVAVSVSGAAVHIYDAATGKQRSRFTLEDHNIDALAFAPDGKALAVRASTDGRVLWCDPATGKHVRSYVLPDDPDPNDSAGAGTLSFSPDGRLLAGVCRWPHRVRIWEVATGKQRLRFPRSHWYPPKFHHPDEHRGGNTGLSIPCLVAFAPDNQVLAWGLYEDLELWDVKTGKVLRQLALPSGDNSVLRGIAFAPDGKQIAAATNDGFVRMWDSATGTVLGDLKGQRGGFRCLAFTPDGKTLITGATDGCILLWDVARALEQWQTRLTKHTPQELERLWKQLGEADAEQIAGVMVQLQTAPEQTVPLIKDRLPPVAVLEAKRIQDLVADLESDRFDVRKMATAELEKALEQAESALRKRLADQPPLDVRQRIEPLLQKAADFVRTPEQMRALRAVELLERIGSPEAQDVLREVAKGATDARLTSDARAALARLTQARR